MCRHQYLNAIAVAASVAAIPFSASSQDVKVEVIPPESGRGAIAVVLSNNSGPDAQRAFARQLASAGYYALLADGRDFLIALGGGDFRGANGARELRRIIAEAQTAPNARPGKAAVVGFAIGGGAALRHAASSPEDVSATVVMYPNLKPLGSDIAGLAAQFKVPVLMLAGAKDTTCCLSGSMQTLVSAPKAVSFEFVSLPEAGHAFDVKGSPGYAEADALAANQKALEFLRRLHPPTGQ